MIEIRMIETEGLSGRREVSIRANALHIDEYIENLIRPLLLAWGFQPGTVSDALGDDYTEDPADCDCNCDMDMHDNENMGEVVGEPEDRSGVVIDKTLLECAEYRRDLMMAEGYRKALSDLGWCFF